MGLLSKKSGDVGRISVPRAESFSDYALAVEKLNSLAARRTALEAELDRLRDERSGERHRLDAQARELLSSGDVPSPAVNTGERLAAVKQELAVTDRAIELQREAIDVVRRTIGGDVRREILPAYGDLVRKAAEHLRGFAAANAELKRVVGELAAAGFSGHEIPPLAVDWLDADERDGRFAGAIQPMRAAGFVD